MVTIIKIMIAVKNDDIRIQTRTEVIKSMNYHIM